MEVYDIRVCPKCGFEDPPYWRKGQGDHYGDMDICRIEDLDFDNPGLAKELREKLEVFDKDYAYRLTLPRKIWVKRRWLQIFKVQGWKPIPYDREAKKRDIKQKKLFETKIMGLEGKKQC